MYIPHKAPHSAKPLLHTFPLLLLLLLQHTHCSSEDERNGSKWLPIKELLCHNQTFAKLSQQMVSLASFLDEAFGKVHRQQALYSALAHYASVLRV